MALTLRKAAIAALLSAAAILPSTARADHNYDKEPLLQAARRLHLSTQRFQRIAAHRPLSPHEMDRIGLLTAQACRLVEDLECLSPWGRVQGDYFAIKELVRILDRRLRLSCGIAYDRPLNASWQRVQENLYAVGCLIDGHGAGYGRGYRRSRPGFSSWAPYRGGPVVSGPVRGNRGRIDGRNPGGRHEELPLGPRRGSELEGPFPGTAPPRGEVRPGPAGFGGAERGPGRNVAPWLRILVAALSR